MKSIILTRLLVSALLLTGMFAARAADLVCSTCGHIITGKYWRLDSKYYCSQACLEKSLPACAECGKRITGDIFVKNKQKYCSMSCLEKTLIPCDLCHKPIKGSYSVYRNFRGDKNICENCNHLPHCFVCTLPCDGVKLADGRVRCLACGKNVIDDPAEAETLFREVRAKLMQQLGPAGDCRVDFFMVGLPEFKKITKGDDELGVYCNDRTEIKSRYGVKTLSESCRIYLLDGLPRDKFIEVAAHEAAHDWMQHKFPGLTDQTIREGFAEYMAYRINLLYNQGSLNRRMEENPDPVYGDGFRKVKAMAPNDNLLDLMKQLKKMEQK